ncbi:MAG: UbiA family prenyltransferase, partial [Tepidisphaeraceae bacterium]
PVRPEVLEFLNQQKESGRRIILATGSDEAVAQAVADRVGLFDGVIASDGTHNLSGRNKLDAIKRDSGQRPFDYIGNSMTDLHVWREARGRVVAGGSSRVANRARREYGTVNVLDPQISRGRALLKAIRPHQWAKNLLVAVPLFVSHKFLEVDAVVATFVAIVAFSLTASAVYVLNDLLDLPSDRAHPLKRRRPFAAGHVPIPNGLLLSGALFVLGMGVALSLSLNFAAMLLLYVVATTAYSLVLKRKLILDVFVLAGLYTLRILAGAVAIHVVASPWLLAFSMFIFISLAFVKRYAELHTFRKNDVTAAPGRRYTVQDMELFRVFGPTSGYVAVLVMCLYISSPDVTKLYKHPEALWLMCPILLFWITRLWFLIDRIEAMDDPVLFALRDKMSYVTGVLVVLVVLLATI